MPKLSPGWLRLINIYLVNISIMIFEKKEKKKKSVISESTEH